MQIERIPFTTRDAWFAARRQDVTASVAGALLGREIDRGGVTCR